MIDKHIKHEMHYCLFLFGFIVCDFDNNYNISEESLWDFLELLLEQIYS